MTSTDPRGIRGLVPLILVGLVVVVVALGLARGLWLANLHNALLGLSLTTVGTYVLFQRPGHREGMLFMAAGVVEGIMFLGRQVGHAPSTEASRWWGWVGVWPLIVALALTTFAVICFPDGRLPAPRWRVVAAVVLAITVICATLSALWPVEYAAAGVITPHPFDVEGSVLATRLWSGIAHPAYLGFQVLWVVALVARWRSSDGLVRRQLAWLAVAATVSVIVLVVGLAIWATPVPGLICVALVPMAAGWAIVHAEHATAYSALTWLSRTGPEPEDLPTDIARATAEAFAATGATLWMGPREQLRAVGLWPETVDDVLAPITFDDLASSPLEHVRAVTIRGTVLGALSVRRPRSQALSLAEERLFADLAAHAGLVIQHLGVSGPAPNHRRPGGLEALTPREHEVLELMARGLTNAAICEELHLSIKTVEPAVSAIFTKLGLHPDATSNRRVLAALTFERNQP